MNDSHSNFNVSVILPIFNSFNYVEVAIDSVLSQTYPISEVIVIDDGSTDGSAILIKNKYPEDIVKVFSIKNVGAAGARNYGISVAKFNWIAFIDSDDKWDLSKLDKQISVLKNFSEIKLLGCVTNMPHFKNKILSDDNILIPISLNMLLFKNYFQTSTVIISSKVLSELGGFPEGRRYAEEGDLFLRIAAKYKCMLINEVLVDYAGGKRGFGVSGLSSNIFSMEIGELNNIYRSFKRRDIDFYLFFLASLFSIIKFIRRFIIYIFNKVFF